MKHKLTLQTAILASLLLGFSLATTTQVIAYKGQPGPNPNNSHTRKTTTTNPTITQTLTDQEKSDLIYMREEEKLARDVYQYLYDQWGLQIFNNIAKSEQQHTNAVKNLLIKYNIPDPVTIDIPGQFNNSDLQSLYDQLIQQGQTSIADALTVGATIEDLDIKDLQNSLGNTNNSDIIRVYNNLMKGSQNHLRAFVAQLKNYNASYQPQYITTEEFNQIISQNTNAQNKRVSLNINRSTPQTQKTNFQHPIISKIQNNINIAPTDTISVVKTKTGYKVTINKPIKILGFINIKIQKTIYTDPQGNIMKIEQPFWAKWLDF